MIIEKHVIDLLILFYYWFNLLLYLSIAAFIILVGMVISWCIKEYFLKENIKEVRAMMPCKYCGAQPLKKKVGKYYIAECKDCGHSVFHKEETAVVIKERQKLERSWNIDQFLSK